MTYQFQINIKPCVNFVTHAAEVSVTDHNYQGGEGSKGIVVRQKHISRAPDNDLAEQVAEQFCADLQAKVVALCQTELSKLRNALP